MTRRRVWILLAWLLTATLATAAMVRELGPADRAQITPPPGALRRVAERPEKPPAEDRVRLDKLRDRNTGSSSGDAFETRGWGKPVAPKKPVVAVPPVAPPPPAPPSVAPAPSAPPLPFTFLGRMSSEEVDAVFLALGERNLVVREGEIIESTYRVDAISDMRLTFTHLPSGIQQQLSFGDAR
jgi:hypothetical protein